MKLLVVEDEKELRKSMLEYLHNFGYVCESAIDYESAIDKLELYEYDCIVLDLNLPGGNGLDLLRIIDRKDCGSSVIIISANNTIEDRVRGLDLGADDFLAKPFHLSELNARIRSVCRRKGADRGRKLIVNEIKMDVESFQVWIHDSEVLFTRKEFELLLYLVNNRNRVVTKSSIAEHLWGDYMDQADSYDYIYTHIKNVRKKMLENGATDYIRTIYGIGYNFRVS